MPRFLFVILGCVLILATLLGLRQQRLTRLHRMADHHAAMDADRKALWDLQVRIAEHTRPQAIEEALKRTGLRLEPIAKATPDETQPPKPASDAPPEVLP